MWWFDSGSGFTTQNLGERGLVCCCCLGRCCAVASGCRRRGTPAAPGYPHLHIIGFSRPLLLAIVTLSSLLFGGCT